jgi:hypothetical protein
VNDDSSYIHTCTHVIPYSPSITRPFWVIQLNLIQVGERKSELEADVKSWTWPTLWVSPWYSHEVSSSEWTDSCFKSEGGMGEIRSCSSLTSRNCGLGPGLIRNGKPTGLTRVSRQVGDSNGYWDNVTRFRPQLNPTMTKSTSVVFGKAHTLFSQGILIRKDWEEMPPDDWFHESMVTNKIGRARTGWPAGERRVGEWASVQVSTAPLNHPHSSIDYNLPPLVSSQWLM